MTNVVFNVSDFLGTPFNGPRCFVELRPIVNPGVSGSYMATNKPIRQQTDNTGSTTFTNVFPNYYEASLHDVTVTAGRGLQSNTTFTLLVPYNSGSIITVNANDIRVTSVGSTNTGSAAYTTQASDNIFVKKALVSPYFIAGPGVTISSSFNGASQQLTISASGGSVTSSFTLSASYATTASYAVTSSYASIANLARNLAVGAILDACAVATSLGWEAGLTPPPSIAINEDLAVLSFIGGGNYDFYFDSPVTANITGSLLGTASIATSASYALTASFLVKPSVLTLFTSSANWLTMSFTASNQQWNLTTGKAYNFTASTAGLTAGAITEVTLYISNSATATSSLSFPSWHWFTGNPTSITASKAAYVTLRYNGNNIDAWFSQEI